MKVLAFADLHGWIEILDLIEEKAKDNEVDLIICGGDLTVFGREQKDVLSRMDAIGIPTLVIPGNHEDEDMLAEHLEEFDNLINLHRASYRKGNFVFFGYGGGGFAKKDHDFESLSKHFSNDILKNDVVTLVTHGPPYKTVLDELRGSYVGSKSISDFIKKNPIKLAISGHIHENFGKKSKLGSAVITNPGPDGAIFDLKNL